MASWLNLTKCQKKKKKKNELVKFKYKRKKLNDTVKIKLSGKMFYPTTSVKYLGIKIDQDITWQHNINIYK